MTKNMDKTTIKAKVMVRYEMPANLVNPLFEAGVIHVEEEWVWPGHPDLSLEAVERALEKAGLERFPGDG